VNHHSYQQPLLT